MRAKEICNECGKSVLPGSGRWVNRVATFNSEEDRKEMGKPFPAGDYVCFECDFKIRDRTEGAEMGLTEEQREEAIQRIIESDMEGIYKPRDIYNAFYYGIPPYKDLGDLEIIEWYEENEIELPTIKEVN